MLKLWYSLARRMIEFTELVDIKRAKPLGAATRQTAIHQRLRTAKPPVFILPTGHQRGQPATSDPSLRSLGDLRSLGISEVSEGGIRGDNQLCPKAHIRKNG